MDRKLAIWTVNLVWWIRQAVGRGVADKGRTIRLPVHMMERVRRALSMQRDLAEALGREPAIEELAGELGEDIDIVEELLTYARTPTSLETPVGEDGDAELGDFIEDRNADDPMKIAANCSKGPCPTRAVRCGRRTTRT